MDAVGQNGAHFSTEITLANRGVTPVSISLTYTASPQFGGPSGTVTDSLPPGRQLVIPDAISYLRNRGLALGSGSQGGSLQRDLYGTLQSGGELRGRANHLSFGAGTRGDGLRIGAAGRRI